MFKTPFNSISIMLNIFQKNKGEKHEPTIIDF